MLGTSWRHHRAVVVGVGIALTTTGAMGFEGDEHRRLGDAAYLIALAFVRQAEVSGASAASSIDADLASLLHERHRSVFRNGLPASAPRNLTYGQIVSCVDQMGGGAETALRHLVSVVPSPAPSTRSEALSRGLRDMCSDPMLGTFAARANASHFGDEGMAAFRFTHAAALRTASQVDDLYGALVTNAVGDHFLTDHFAPGHVAADRRALTDSSAVGVHDLANRAGSRYRVVSEPAVRTIAMWLCGSVDGTGLLRGALVSEEEQSMRRSSSLPKWPNRDDGSVFRTLDHLKRSCDWLLKASGDVVVFRGDDFLFRASADDQRLFMLLTQVVSIVEVLEAGKPDCSKQLRSSMFHNFRWDPKCRDACEDDRIRASVHARSPSDGAETGLSGGYLAFSELPGVLPDRASEDAPVFARTPYEPGTRAIMLGFSGEFATRAGKSQLGRAVGVAEVWIPVPGTDNFWGVIGAAISQEREHTFGYWGTGPEVRLAYGLTTFPGTTVSGYYRNIKYGASDLAGHLRVEHFGVRIDHGLSDLFGMYVALHDTVGSYERVVHGFDDWGLSFGVSVKIPGLRAFRFIDND